jgi:hypothetical protein
MANWKSDGRNKICGREKKNLCDNCDKNSRVKGKGKNEEK